MSKKLGGDKRRSGPRLPAFLHKELDRMNNTSSLNNSENEDEEIDSDEGNDFYEYEEPLPQEESRKNLQFDPVENYGTSRLRSLRMRMCIQMMMMMRITLMGLVRMKLSVVVGEVQNILMMRPRRKMMKSRRKMMKDT